jgi:hypothetical protein
MANKYFDDHTSMAILIDKKFYNSTVHKHVGRRSLDSVTEEALRGWAAERTLCNDGRFPSWRYGRLGEEIVAQNAEEAALLGESFKDSPWWPQTYYHSRLGICIVKSAAEEDSLLASDASWSQTKPATPTAAIEKLRREQIAAKAAKASTPAQKALEPASAPAAPEPANALPVSTSAAATAAPVK